jgi:hypothetical protein
MHGGGENEGGGSGLPRPSIDPPEPPRPDAIDTWSPGLTDESGEVAPASPVVGEEGADPTSHR